MTQAAFDLTVQHRDQKTGRVIRHTPYRRRISKDGDTFERPVNSGNVFYADGVACGRITREEGKGELWDKAASHIALKPEASPHEVLVAQMGEKDQLIAQQAGRLAELEQLAIEKEQAGESLKVPVKSEEKPAVKVASKPVMVKPAAGKSTNSLNEMMGKS